jgi:hypothetical protein
LATLDETGATEGLPFMPEMLEFFGGTFRVQARVERACDTLKWGVRRLPDTVMLDDLRCTGQGHAGCQAGCRLYWKEAWLRPASGSATTMERDDAYSELERLVGENVDMTPPTTDERIFRCQATDWFEASEPVGWWNLRSFVNEWTCGNVTLWQLARTMTRAVLREIGSRLRLIPRETAIAHHPSIEPVDSPSVQGLAPGTLVQIRSKQEIARSLDEMQKTKGLAFDPPSMLPYCGKTVPVKMKVERFIDERTGKLVQLKSDCYILDGVVCSGDRNAGKWFCPRAIYPWWREAWLQPVDEDRE